MQLGLLVQLVAVVANEVQLGEDGLVVGTVTLQTVEVLPVDRGEGLDEVTLLVQGRPQSPGIALRWRHRRLAD